MTTSEERFFLVEIWEENREIFKILISDALFFFLLLGILALAHPVITRIPVSPEQKDLIETLHFVFTITIWCIMFVVMIVELILALTRRAKSHGK